jgi:uncharacterized protein
MERNLVGSPLPIAHIRRTTKAMLPASPVGPGSAVTNSAAAKESALKHLLASYGRALVAFSAGVDSTYLLDVAHEVLGERVIAVTADSPSLARSGLAEAEAFCRDRGIRFQRVGTDEFADAAYVANDGKRCYHCKAALMRAMDGLARAAFAEHGDAALLLGAIADDRADYRPGMQASAAAGARWPLAETGFTKAEVRERSQIRGLATWNRPASPCLASRIPYGEPITSEALAMVERAENILRELGFAECRARHHRVGEGRGHLCRIEVPVASLESLVAQRVRLVTELRALGYLNVCVDLAGFASGGFNRMLSDQERQQP